MMEPVAWMDDGTTRTGSETTGFRVVHADTKATMPRASSDNFTVALVRLSDAEARIAELTKWRDEWKDMATELKGLVEEWQGRAEAAEALLKEATRLMILTRPEGEGWTVIPGSVADEIEQFIAARALKEKP